MARRAIDVTVAADAVRVTIDGRAWSLAIGADAKGSPAFDVRQLHRLQRDGVELTPPEMAKLLKRILFEAEFARLPLELAWLPMADSPGRGSEFRWRWRWWRWRATSRDGAWQVQFDERRSLAITGASWRLELG